MNKKDLYLRRQYTARRGGYKKRYKIPFFALQRERRNLNPKWNNWGDQSHFGSGAHLNEFHLDKQEARKDGHKIERRASTLNKNFRRAQNPMKDRRRYWKKEREEL